MRSLVFASLLFALPAFAAPEFVSLGPNAGLYAISADGSTAVGALGFTWNTFEAFRWTRAEGVVPLGFLQPGCQQSRALRASADGAVIVGSSCGTAFRWTRDAGMVAIEDAPNGFHPSEATAVSADGSTVTGTGISPSNPTEGFPFRWTSEDGTDPLGSLPGWFRGYGFWISDDGSVVAGNAGIAGGEAAFRWTQDDGLVGLTGGQPGPAHGMSSDGSVVVGDLSFVFPNPAFRWTEAGGFELLGALAPGLDSHAYHISADGSVVVGYSGAQAFRWTAADGMVGLGDLPGGNFSSLAERASADGSVVVGRGNTPWIEGGSYQTVFVWDAQHGMRDLSEIVPLPLQTPGNQCLVPLVAPMDLSRDGRVLVGTLQTPDCVRTSWVAVLRDAACDDGADNDGDGAADFPNDPGCATADDDSEHGATLPCDDGIDNDGDALIDFPADIGCKNLTHTEDPHCQDGLDNDGDGKIDFDGGASLNDGIPLGTIDPGCEGKSFRKSETTSSSCGLGAEVALVIPLLALMRRRVVR